ncbi:MAG: 30S ribosomal protein S17 [Chlamydiales bacterium]|nr:30S ribosomal protein S17 [Chlamydiales bacterium]MCH9619779.1 30S ribosomal protein S17 [Chlamydiales bacterium]MCH9623385.1 30S ribosomal protein S17 [Chlamydiales bacterium]
MTKEKTVANQKVKQGVVISNKMDKTAVVQVERTYRHPVYGKVMKSAKKYYAHHEGQKLPVGTKVLIKETRPLSKLKRWRVVNGG